jgi:hypothetical protein
MPSRRHLVLVLIVLSALVASAWEWPKMPDVKMPSVDDVKAGIKGARDSIPDMPSVDSIKAGIAGAKEGMQNTMPDSGELKDMWKNARSALTDLAKRSEQGIMDGVVSINALRSWLASFVPYLLPPPALSEAMKRALVQHEFEAPADTASVPTWRRERDNAIAIVIGGLPSWDEKKKRAAGASETPADADVLSELTLVMRVVVVSGQGFGLSTERLDADATITVLGVWNKTEVGIPGLSISLGQKPLQLKLGLFASAIVAPELAAAESNGNRQGCRVHVTLMFRAQAKVLAAAVKSGLKLVGSGLADLTKFSARLYDLDIFFPMEVSSYLSGAAAVDAVMGEAVTTSCEL